MSTIHFVGGEKGGVGKSVFARVLAQYMIDRGETFTGFDADNSNGTMTRFYGQFSQSIDLQQFERADIIIEKACSEPLQAVVDLPAQSQAQLSDWIYQNELLSFCKEQDIKLVFWFLMDEGKDSNMLASQFLEQFSGELPIVLVKNFGRGRNFDSVDELLALYDTCDTVSTMELAELYSSTMLKIDNSDMDFWGAAQDRTTSMTMMERQRVKMWLKRCYTAIDISLQTINQVSPMTE